MAPETVDPTLAPVTPGDVLGQEFLTPLGISARQLARELGWPANRITGLLWGERRMTARSAIALGERFGTTAEFWMHLQTAHDLETAGYQRTVPVMRTDAPEGGR
jgi:addiction module HigA family antidote